MRMQKVPGRFSPPSRPEYKAKGDLLVAVYIMLRKPEKMGGGVVNGLGREERRLEQVQLLIQ